MAYNKLSTYRTKISAVAGVLYNVQYHATTIVQCYDEAGRAVIELNTGGYASVTTKRKMNQAAHQFGLGYGVHQRKHRWYVTTKAGEFAFDDRVFVIDRDTGLPWVDALAYVADMAAEDAGHDVTEVMNTETYLAHLEREADKAAYDHSFASDPYGMHEERSRHP